MKTLTHLTNLAKTRCKILIHLVFTVLLLLAGGNLNSQENPLLTRMAELVDENKTEEAIAMGKQHIEKYPQDPFGYAALGEIYYELDEYELALELLEKAELEKNQMPDYYERFAVVLFFQAHYEKAGYFANLAIQHESFTISHYIRAFWYRKQGDRKKELADYDYLIDTLGNDYEDFIWQRVHSLMANGNYDRALRDINHLLDISRESKYFYTRGIIMMQNEEYEKAEKDFLACLEEDAGYIQAFYELIIICSEQRRFEDALNTIEMCLLIHPEDQRSRHARILILKEMNNLDEACEEARKLYAGSPFNEDYFDILFNILDIKGETEELDQLFSSFDELPVADIPDVVLFHRSYFNGMNSRFHEALSDLNHLIARSYKPANHYYSRGLIYYYVFKELEKACADCLIAHKLGNPDALEMIEMACDKKTVRRVQKEMRNNERTLKMQNE